MTNSQIVEVEQNVNNLFKRFETGDFYNTLYQQFYKIKEQVNYQKRRRPIQIAELTDSNIELIKSLAREEKIQSPKMADLKFLVQFIGSTNVDIREKYVLKTIVESIKKHYYTENQLIWLRDFILDLDNLYSHILEPKNDAVLVRSGALLILNAILVEDEKFYNLLSPQDYQSIALRLATYSLLEQDYQGYNSKMGWIQTYSLIVEATKKICEAPVHRALKVYLMTAVVFAYLQTDVPLIFGENQGLADLISSFSLRDNFYDYFILMLLTQWNEQYKDDYSSNEQSGFWHQVYNSERLLDSLLVLDDLSNTIRNLIKNEIK
ncbi:DUF2785 domain-containing protein [Holzapfeliella floricola]|uniref:Uncharacterized protein n=1 Tax=Holzapfeliella floricola DSM 23037 = JCM 16512 TaxID=1423744 RepID=A0A0R2DJE2_9LACO|nr:DUF2785 domain-containing protein [Holzapfeliella floricola]KRN03571.1 hypothetical protein FC86_GL000677 [Holzapfeliella floricola DSM 23037 = JCM 16512]